MRKKWKVYGLFVLLIIILGVCSLSYDSSRFTSKVVTYQGNNLRVSIDGVSSSNLPTSGTYYLISYECDNDKTEVSWDSSSYELTVTNGKNGGGVSCDLTFKSNPKLYELPVGSYVAYTGSGGTVGSTSVACQTNGSKSSSKASAETEAPNSCSGQNAREDLDTSGYTYGYCYSRNYSYYTTGWRIAYIDTTDASNPRAILISAGSPECNSRTKSTANVTYIQTANAKALKYCNTNYVDGNCTCTDSDADGLCDSPSTDAWAINDTDFYYMTKAISGYGKRLASDSSGADSSLGDSGGALGTTLYCYAKDSYQECGYNNDLLDNGGYYWFADRYSSSDAGGVSRNPNGRGVSYSTNTYAYGLRPVIRLSSSVSVTGGVGTMKDPYTIGNYYFSILNGARYIGESDKNNVQLTLFGNDVSQMCISVDTSSCSNYIDFATSYILDWSSEADGEKIVYVKFKDSDGNVIAELNKSIVIDTVAPSNNSVTIGSESDVSRTLTLSSTGADYMCFSNTSSIVSDCTDWVAYATSYNWRLSDGEGEKTVYAFFKDEAGNVGSVASDTITFTKSCLGVGEVYAIDYSGDVLTSGGADVKFCAGTYRLQAWGAQGGNTGGKGGYSVGEITLSGTETMYFYVGGSGGTGAAAGFNGGGTTGSKGGAGGGATDIRINTDSLYARVIVAGGGGGKGQDSCAAGAVGGGTSGGGGASQNNCGTQAGGGTQTSGGAVGVYNSTNGANAGTFGVGGNAADGSYDGGGGGGGWYGGGAGASAGYSNGGGGGSGFVYSADTASNVPSGWLLTSTYYLTNASTTDGAQSTIPTTDGNGTETGHASNGYLKITRLS